MGGDGPRSVADVLQLSAGLRRLWHGDEAVALTPKAFAVLRRLVEDGGRLVSKEELLRAGWPKTHVTGGVLKAIIREIRRALGDDSTAPSFIETAPRRGYRFIAPRGRAAGTPALADPRAAPVGRGRVIAQLGGQDRAPLRGGARSCTGDRPSPALGRALAALGAPRRRRPARGEA